MFRSNFLKFMILLSFISWLAMPAETTSAAGKYTGGLLDGVTMQLGTTVGTATGTVTTLTDGDVATSKTITATQSIWYSFAAPQSINSIIVNYFSSSSYVTPQLYFYDANNTLLYNYTPLTNDGVESLPTVIDNVSLIVVKSTSTTKSSIIYELNLFQTPSAAPVTPEISWIQGHDSVVDLFWNHTGAQSYNVKRSSSASGPFTTIAANLKERSYSDNTAVNGNTYYYVVSASNEAGESTDSTAKSIKPMKTKYTGGLLDRAELSVGMSVSNPTGTTRVLTDNVEGNNFNMTTSSNSVVFYRFPTPQSVNSVITASFISTTYKLPIMEFYDDNGNLLSSYTPIGSGNVESLPNTLNNVSLAVLKVNANPSSVNEWNLFSHPSAAPAVPTINFIQGHDGTVDLFWNHVGAKSYTIKRSTSAGGPYATIKTGVSGSSYTDVTVTNNTTYYYVVSSVNEAGESPNSSEKTVTPHASNYTGGLLDRKPLGFGSTVLEPPSTIKRETTDNNINTSLVVSSGDKLFYTFPNAVDIHSSIVNFTNSAPILEFYDNNNNLLLAYTPITSGVIEGLPASVTNVKSVVLRYNTTTNKYSNIIEWNLFGEDHATAPAAPLNLTAVGGDKKVTLSWSTVNNTTGYTIKRSLTAGGPYTVLTTVSAGTSSYIDSAVTNGTTYYYVVTADNATGSSADSNEASAIPSGVTEEPQEPPVENEGTRALLRIMLMTGEMKEYDVSMSVVDAFIGWYELRASGTGPITFAIDKSTNNIGPFANRKDYIIFDKIITFEVNAYNVNTGSSSEL